MAATLRLEIVTPDRRTYSEEVDMVVLPGVEGELGILPMHVPMLTQIKPGEVRVVRAGVESFLAVGEGFVEITQERVSLLTDMAVEESAINEAEAEAAMERARAAMNNHELGDEEIASAEAMVAKSLAQLNLKRRRRG